MNELQTAYTEKALTLDSREVAEMTGKEHKNLLRDIKSYVDVLTSSNLSPLSFFIESIYRDSKGETRPCYLLTKKGCDMVANKMTGQKGIKFTAEYIDKFYKMEKQILSPQKQLSPLDQLRLQYQVLEEQQKQLETVEKKVDDLESSMPLFNTDCKELQKLVRKVATQALGGYKSIAYNDKSLRSRVYSDIQKQLRREFGVERYEAIKRCQFEKAKEIVTNYRLPLVLEDEIILANDQISMLGA